MSIEQMLNDYYSVKQQLNILKKDEAYIRKHILEAMKTNRTNMLNTDNYVCVRTFQTREIIRKENVPEEIWSELKEVIQYPILRINFI